MKLHFLQVNNIVFDPLSKELLPSLSTRKRWKDNKTFDLSFVLRHLLHVGALGSLTFLHNHNHKSFIWDKPDYYADSKVC